MKSIKKTSFLEFYFSAISLRISSSFISYPYWVISGYLKLLNLKKISKKFQILWPLVSSWMRKTVLWYLIRFVWCHSQICSVWKNLHKWFWSKPRRKILTNKPPYYGTKYSKKLICFGIADNFHNVFEEHNSTMIFM
jgi:hypothetical protein